MDRFIILYLINLPGLVHADKMNLNATIPKIFNQGDEIL
jgi:hypothetical protein